MSKRDIQVVCELAAHLALKAPGRYPLVGAYASDAMALQRLGRSARNMYARLAKDFRGVTIHNALAQTERIEAEGNTLLKPYGLSCHVEQERVFVIDGLPGNTGGGDQDGFGI